MDLGSDRRCGYLIDDIFLLHDPGSRHPEAPRRLTAVRKALEGSGLVFRWRRIDPRPARLEELELVHHLILIEQVEKASRRAPSHLDADTVVSEGSYRAALFAAGGTLECVEAICTGNLRRAFAFVRPPGHHAGPDRSMGFCLFNNAALAAAYARVKHRFERVAIVDIDVHHGNGTQACFYDDPHVLFVSTHQFPFYPGTGAMGEVGQGEGRGFTINFPLPEGSGDEVFVPVYSRIVRALIAQFRPQLIIVSAGFDAHFLDPLGDLRVTSAGYASAAASLILAAEETCEGKICFVLEGGYSLDALEECARAVTAQMEAPRAAELPLGGASRFRSISAAAAREFGEFWKW